MYIEIYGQNEFLIYFILLFRKVSFILRIHLNLSCNIELIWTGTIFLLLQIGTIKSAHHKYTAQLKMYLFHWFRIKFSNESVLISILIKNPI